MELTETQYRAALNNLVHSEDQRLVTESWTQLVEHDRSLRGQREAQSLLTQFGRMLDGIVRAYQEEVLRSASLRAHVNQISEELEELEQKLEDVEQALSDALGSRS